MKNYRLYMERQKISSAAHERLVNLEAPAKRRSPAWAQSGALAACAALIVSVGVWKLASASSPAPNTSSAGQFASGYTPLPGETDTVGPEDHPLAADRDSTGAADFHGFMVNSPAEEGQYMNFYAMPAIAYPDRSGAGEIAASIALPDGSFMADLEKEDIQRVFWPEGKPENTGYDLPWALFWDGYTVHGYAWYNGQGELFQAYIFGEKGRAAFQLTLCPGRLPLTCLVDPDRETSEAFGVAVTGWSRAYDRDGDGQTDYICGSEFMTESGVGVRFESWNNGSSEDGLDGEAWFNTLLVRQALVSDGGLYLDHLMVSENIPAWRVETFDTLAQARQEADFAPYLPAAEPSGYNEFHGRLSYQEGSENLLFVRWSRGYDNVEVDVYRDGYHTYYLADPDRPETYDLSLYPIPWCDSVPREYWDTVNDPAFLAEDMSLSLVEARGREHDTGGMTYSFDVLHPDGALVSYRCDGLTAQQVWALVEPTL